MNPCTSLLQALFLLMRNRSIACPFNHYLLLKCRQPRETLPYQTNPWCTHVHLIIVWLHWKHRTCPCKVENEFWFITTWAIFLPTFLLIYDKTVLTRTATAKCSCVLPHLTPVIMFPSLSKFSCWVQHFFHWCIAKTISNKEIKLTVSLQTRIILLPFRVLRLIVSTERL